MADWKVYSAVEKKVGVSVDLMDALMDTTLDDL